jgi:peptidoglycan/LPS O-acetylase OafA/YrhL
LKYRAEIDGLRALAVLPVILFHAGFEWFSGGFVGVDVFFVISGYLITTIIISEMAEGKFSIVNFYERRARRILPALFFVMLACLPFAWLWLTPTDLKDFGQSLVAVSTFSSNILFWLESGYFDTAAELKPLLHTWSLAVEEQYYILFPVFLMLTWRLGIKTILILLSIVFLISLGAAVWGTQYAAHPKIISGAFFLLPTRGWELLIGVFAAFYLKYNTHLKSHTVNQMLSLLGFGMIAYSIIAFDKTTPFPSLYALIPTIGTGLLILCAVPKTFVHRLLSLKYIVGIGLISYSAYIWHQPLLAFARHKVEGDVAELHLIILCITSLLMAWFSWRFVEGPFRSKEKISFRRLWISSGVTLFLFIGLGLYTHVKEGFPTRINSDIDLSTMMPSPLRTDCHTKDLPCEYFGENVEWATFGDSHVVELSYALASNLKKYNVGVEHNSHTRCKPSVSDTGSKCYVWTKQTLERLVASETVKNIVVSYRLALYLFGQSEGVYPSLPDEGTDGDRETIWKALLKILSELSESGKQVYFVVQAPELPYHIQRIAFFNQSDTSKRIKGVNRAWWDHRNMFVFERLGELPEDVIVVDPTDLFCDPNWCYVSNSNGFLYFDDDHLSVYGATIVVEEFLNRNE